MLNRVLKEVSNMKIGTIEIHMVIRITLNNNKLKSEIMKYENAYHSKCTKSKVLENGIEHFQTHHYFQVDVVKQVALGCWETQFVQRCNYNNHTHELICN